MLNTLRSLAFLAAAFLPAAPALAQQSGPPLGWVTSVEGIAAFQGNADLDDGGSFSTQRYFLRAGGLYTFPSGNSAGISLSFGQLSYDFDDVGAAPWGDINDLRISLPLRFRLSDTVNAFLAPSLRYDYEDGADMDDGMTWGAFGGVTWRINDRLTIGPGIGVFSELKDDDDLTVFPALLIDWDIADRWNLSTGTGLGSTQGPGLSLNYAQSDALSFGLSVRSERVQFRLDDDGLAPDGTGEDSSFPVVLTVNYEPTPLFSVSGFAGMETGGELKLYDADGARVSKESYDPAPVAGFAFRLRF